MPVGVPLAPTAGFTLILIYIAPCTSLDTYIAGRAGTDAKGSPKYLSCYELLEGVKSAMFNDLIHLLSHQLQYPLRVGLRVVGLRVVGLWVGAVGVGNDGVCVVKMLFAQVAGMFDSMAYGCLQCKVVNS